MAWRKTFLVLALTGIITAFIFLAKSVLSTDPARLEAYHLGGEFLGREGVRMQCREYECGVAALLMVYDHFGIASTPHELTSNLRCGVNGTSMLSLQREAEKRGLDAAGWRLSFAELAHQRFPAILFVHHDHFIVADSIVGDAAYVRDPAVGRMRIPQRKLLRIWGGEALLFGNR